MNLTPKPEKSNNTAHEGPTRAIPPPGEVLDHKLPSLRKKDHACKAEAAVKSGAVSNVVAARGLGVETFGGRRWRQKQTTCTFVFGET